MPLGEGEGEPGAERPALGPVPDPLVDEGPLAPSNVKCPA